MDGAGLHIRFNRARRRLRVAGYRWKATSKPVINLLRQCGHHFDAEGIKVIEFARLA